MNTHFIEFIFLILIILALIMIANKLRVAYPIILVLGGLALSVTSVFSHVTIDPGMVFYIFLPPLLYLAAWQTSWKEFWKWRRVITIFAFPMVIVTSFVIAYVSTALIPGFTMALGFLLGGIVSPPDAISATTIMRQVNAPRSLVNIIEGESLLNDASSLIVFRFALVAVISGQFVFSDAAGSFFVVIFMGILIGLLVAGVFYFIHRLLPTTPSMDVILTLVTPYSMYYAAEHFHYSGVLAVVSGGLLLSALRQQMLSYRSRIEGVNVWNNLAFVLNGLVFLLIGLQLPVITQQLGTISISRAIWYGLSISLVLIITRLFMTFGAALFTRFAGRYIKVADPNPGWKAPLIAGWAGMRGVVSLAAALSIPLMLSSGIPFPFRNLILFITFIVILVTLVFQGLTLPWLIRKIKPEERSSIPEHEQEKIIRKKITETSLEFLKTKYGNQGHNNHLHNLMSKLEIDFNFLQNGTGGGNGGENPLTIYQSIYLELLDEQRKLLINLNKSTEFDEELIRKYLALTDIEELKVREKLIQEE